MRWVIALHRPAIFRVPAAAIRLLMGESAVLVLGGQRAAKASGGRRLCLPLVRSGRSAKGCAELMADTGGIGAPDSALLAHAPRLDGLTLALQHRHIQDNQRPLNHHNLPPAGRFAGVTAKQSAKVGFSFCVLTAL